MPLGESPLLRRRKKFAEREKPLKTYCLPASEFLNHSSKASLASECGLADNAVMSPSSVTLPTTQEETR